VEAAESGLKSISDVEAQQDPGELSTLAAGQQLTDKVTALSSTITVFTAGSEVSVPSLISERVPQNGPKIEAQETDESPPCSSTAATQLSQQTDYQPMDQAGAAAKLSEAIVSREHMPEDVGETQIEGWRVNVFKRLWGLRASAASQVLASFRLRGRCKSAAQSTEESACGHRDNDHVSQQDASPPRQDPEAATMTGPEQILCETTTQLHNADIMIDESGIAQNDTEIAPTQVDEEEQNGFGNSFEAVNRSLEAAFANVAASDMDGADMVLVTVPSKTTLVHEEVTNEALEGVPTPTRNGDIVQDVPRTYEAPLSISSGLTEKFVADGEAAASGTMLEPATPVRHAAAASTSATVRSIFAARVRASFARRVAMEKRVLQELLRQHSWKLLQQFPIIV
jgi:hypothetical protein